MKLAFFLAFVTCVLDQISKWWVFERLLTEARPVVALIPSLNFVKAWNTGVSFSMFSNHSAWGPYLLSTLALGIVAGLCVWLYRLPEEDKITPWALGFVIGGAIGNVIDRLRFGAVADFIDVYVGTYHWPAFNVADSAVTLGAGLLIFDALFVSAKQDKKSEE